MIAIVHQPSTDIFDLFDRIYMLSEGREVYQGPNKALYSYFQDIGDPITAHTNPADELIKKLHAKENSTPDECKARQKFYLCYEEKIRDNIKNEIGVEQQNAQDMDSGVLKKFRATGFGLQFGQLIVRATRNLFRNTTFTKVRIGQTVVLGIIIDLLFWNKSSYSEGDVKDKNGAFFFICTAQFMLAIQSVLLTCKNICL